jgi:hypothetical protein
MYLISYIPAYISEAFGYKIQFNQTIHQFISSKGDNKLLNLLETIIYLHYKPSNKNSGITTLMPH